MYGNGAANAYKLYEEKSISTASAEKLLIMLYEGAVKFCRFAEISIDEKNYENKNKYIIKVQDILNELKITLNHDSGEIAMDLERLYNFMIVELIQANINNDKEQLIVVKEMLIDLKNTWEKII